MLLLPLCFLSASAPAPPTTVVKTVYRITPRNYTGLTNFDTGDAAGDAFFGLYELQSSVECSGAASSTNGLLCRNEPILQIPGFNVYEQFELEMDARTGDYAECNPDTRHDPVVFECTHFHRSSSCWYNDKDHPQWATEFADVCSKSECSCDAIETKAVGAESVADTFGHFKSNASYPAVCKAEHYSQYEGYFPTGLPASRALKGVSEAECCSACTQLGRRCSSYGFEYATGTCHTFSVTIGARPEPGSSIGFIDSSGSNLTRTLSKQTAALAERLNGTWYSTQAAGECGPNQKIGDGCYWRVKNMTRNVNASCVNSNLVQAALAANSSCWAGCPQPTNMSSPCWVSCLFDTVAGNPDTGVPAMPRGDLIAAFENSFASADPAAGGCPEVPPCPTPCTPPEVQGDAAGLLPASSVVELRRG